MKDYSLIKLRQKISNLIFQVLTHKICVRQALERFPEGIEDESSQCIWHALIHYEADEEYRIKDFNYAEEQNNFLTELALILQKGEALPLNIMAEYKQYYEPNVKPSHHGILNKIKNLFRFII